jgi:hypothetical protein
MNGDCAVPTSAPSKTGDISPKTQVLRSLGRLVRGLSTVFWCLPLVLITYVQTARTEWLQSLHSLAMLPSVFVSALLWWGLMQLRQFQPQERIWQQAVDRAEIFSILNMGLSPFLFWWREMPSTQLYLVCVSLLAISSVLLLVQLNRVLERLAAMLPDETLRSEMKLFAGLNTWLLAALLLAVAVYFGLEAVNTLPEWMDRGLDFVTEHGPWMMLFVILIPLALTMALVWKTKEIIFASVFDAQH